MPKASKLYVAISEITGEELGGFTSRAKAAAAAAAYDTPARKAAFTKRQTGAAKAAGAKAAATRAAKAGNLSERGKRDAELALRREADAEAIRVRAAQIAKSGPSPSRRGWLRATPAEAARHIAKSGAKMAIYRLV